MSYKFIDLFAGIGGFHIALSRNQMECVFASEIDKEARKTYLANHQIDQSIFNEDITKIDPNSIPDHDILCAGFPCQPFSQAGHKKGFNDDRGNLFTYIHEILKVKKPKAFILENVRHLLKHDEGRTFNVIYDALTSLDYYVEYKIIKASEFGRPQHRPRIYIVGFHNKLVDTSKPYIFPTGNKLELTMSDVWGASCTRDIGFTLRVGGKSSPINDRRNWDGYIVNGEIRRLSPNEGKKMMGFPDDFKFPTNKSQAMKQLGNSVCVDVVECLAKEMKNYLESSK